VAIRSTTWVAIALLWSAPAWAADLRLALGAQGEYDSNIYNRETKVRDDFVITAVPDIRLLESEGKFTYDVGYSFPYQRSIQTNALRNFNHVARVGADYHLSDRTQFSFSDRFSYQQALSSNFDDTPTIGQDDRNQQILRNRAEGSARYRFTPRLSNETTLGQEIFTTTQDDRSDNQSYSILSALDYMLTERQTLGGGVQTSFQHFNESDDDAESQSIFVGPFLSWSYRIDEQSQVRISAGPTYVYSKREDFTLPVPPPPALPPNPPRASSDSDSRIAGFGALSIDRRWSPTMVSGVSYQRRQDTASGISGSAILDAVALTHDWILAERWTLALRADWTKRKSATNLQVSTEGKLDTQRWGAGAVLSYRITRNLTGSVRYQYTDQNSNGRTAGRFSDFEGHIATFGLNYALDPIEVW
jgi:long-subunit fatty acid transport protein